MKKEVLVSLITTVLFLTGCYSHQNQFGICYSDSADVCGKNINLGMVDTLIWISDPTHPCCEELQGGRFFHYHKHDSVFTTFISCDSWNNGTIIDEHISDCVFDDMFLLADQKPLDSILGKQIQFYYDDGRPKYSRREYDTIENYKKKLKMLEDSPIHQYWILNMETAEVYGPLSFEDYLYMKKQLGVPTKLMLKREKKES